MFLFDIDFRHRTLVAPPTNTIHVKASQTEAVVAGQV